MRRFKIYLFSLLLLQLLSDTALAAPAFWQAQKNGQSIYLFGSVHLGKADFYPLPNSIMRAFEQSRVLVVEVNVQDEQQQQLVKLLQEWGLSRTPLSQSLSAKGLAVYQRYCQQEQLPCQQFEAYRPWFLATQLAVAKMQQLGYSEQYGVDRQFIDWAMMRAKPIVEMESLQAQISYLADLNAEQQEFMLLQALQNSDDEVHQLFRSWQAGDTIKLESLVFKQSEQPIGEQIQRILFDHRNKKMADKLVTFAAENKTIFVVVGAGHLLGERSILEYLENSGFKINRR